MEDAATSETVGVYAKIRPRVGEPGEQREINVKRRFDQQKSIQARNLEFSLDWVWDEDATQEDVYDIVGRDRVARVLEGCNVCLLAYGQTGSGKTYTMFGPDEVLEDFASSDFALHGLAPRAIVDLFEFLQQAPSDSEFVVHCSYVEVYNDACNDLLGKRKDLKLLERRGGRVTVEGLSSEIVTSSAEVMAALGRGNANRVVAAMKMNARSSRSHAIFSLSLLAMHGGGESYVEAGRLTLVDLAGMESSKKSYSVEGASSAPQRREEAKNINTSLYALGTVIERLSASTRAPRGANSGASGHAHVPFRDSKLTRLLQERFITPLAESLPTIPDILHHNASPLTLTFLLVIPSPDRGHHLLQESLGGNCAVAIVVTLRTEADNVDESIGTLRFAQRAKAVPVVVRPNNAVGRLDAVQLEADLGLMREELSAAQSMIERLQQELRERDGASIEADVKRVVASLGGSPAAERVARLEIDNKALRSRNRTLRISCVWLRLMALARKERLRRVEADSTAALDHGLGKLGREQLGSTAELFSGSFLGGGGGAHRESFNHIARLASSRHVIQGGGGGGGGGAGERSCRGLSRGLTMGGTTSMAGATEEAKRYIRFHQLATDRKLFLASRGFEVENVFIDELYDDAKRELLGPERWHDFLRRQIPSPRPQRGPGGGGDGSRWSKVVNARVGAAPQGTHARPAVLRRMAMPFQSWKGGGDQASPRGRDQGRDELERDSREAKRRHEQQPEPSAGRAIATLLPRNRSVRPVAPGGLMLDLGDGPEDWRIDLELGPLPSGGAADHAYLGADAGLARGGGNGTHSSAYALAQAGCIMANAAAVRAAPAKRAADEAAKASLRAAAASQEARQAASMAGAARAQAQARATGSETSSPQPSPANRHPAEERAKVRLLPPAQ